MNTKVTEKSIADLLSPATDFSDINAGSEDAFSKVVFDLYRETAIVIVLSASLHESFDQKEGVLSRNQAIGAGLVIRIVKFMKAIMALLVDKVSEHGEVVMALNRCITESATNLKFFCEKANVEDFEEFIKSSLKPEKEMYAFLQEKIKRRGSILPIETRMLKSITGVFKISGIAETEIDKLIIPRRKDYKTILTALDMESIYPMLQGIQSHSIHGSWVDLVKHHIEEVDSGFRPTPESVTPDPRLLCPINVFVLMAVESYIRKYFPENDKGISVLLIRITDLIKRLTKIESLHEEKLSKNS
ncbi:MAG: DUF5677 domain-containing protein [Patescibacteria group bacterium]